MALNAFFIFIIFYLDIPDILNIDAEPSASLGALLTYVINYLVLNTILVMAISSLIQTLSKKLNEEKVLSSQLKNKNEEYAEAIKRAEASDKLKSEFLANMSHEIRTPLNAIIGFSDILATEKENPNQKDHSQTIKTSALRLLHVITDIVDASKLSTGQMKIVKTAFNLQEALDELHPMLQELITKSDKDLFLILKHPEYIPNTINADKEKLERIILHLTENAIKNTEFGMIKITYDYNESKGLIIFQVKDTGKGISEKEINLIFNPFYQNEGEFNEGNGLGLTICKGFTELWGGKISVVSSPGTGSTFTFTIPL
jgi:signal transduction histidine kinase